LLTLDFGSPNSFPIKDLTPLKEMPLEGLGIAGCPAISDLKPLKGMPLKTLLINSDDKIKDLMPLQGMPLETLWMDWCKAVRAWK